MNTLYVIGMNGYYVPNIDEAVEMRRHDIPGLLEYSPMDQRLTPDQMHDQPYKNAVAEGFPMMNTDQYATVLKFLGITDWASKSSKTEHKQHRD